LDTIIQRQTGWIEVVCGSMFSGKTEELIRRVRRAQIARQKVELFKPQIDTRYSKDEIVSHDDQKLPSRVIKDANEIIPKVCLRFAKLWQIWEKGSSSPVWTPISEENPFLLYQNY
jgi:hypothetical protein